MADDLSENYLIEKEFIPTINEIDHDSNDSDLVQHEHPKVQLKKDSNKRKIHEADSHASNSSNLNKKKRRKKKNITEILKLREHLKIKPSQPINELVGILIKYMNENLSSVEKNDLNLATNDEMNIPVEKRLKEMILKRKKTYKLSIEDQFKIKFNKILSKFLENKQDSSKKGQPIMIVLCSSAIRCIELQKIFSSSVELIKSKKLFWTHAFAKHKKVVKF